MLNRRTFNKLAAAAAIAECCNPRIVAAAGAGSPRFSVMLWTLEKHLNIPFADAVDVIAAAGYHSVELTFELAQWSPDELEKARAKLQSAQVGVDVCSGMKVGFANPSATDAMLAEVRNEIEKAKKLNCPMLNMTSGKRVDGLTREQGHQACIDNLKRVVDLLDKNDMRLVIEPIDLIENKNAYLNSVVEGFEIVRAIGSPRVKVLYDFYHEQRGDDESTATLIDKVTKNFDLIGLVHIAETPDRTEPGTGKIDYPAIYKELAALHYKGYIAMEFFPTKDPRMTLEAARIEAQKYFT